MIENRRCEPQCICQICTCNRHRCPPYMQKPMQGASASSEASDVKFRIDDSASPEALYGAKYSTPIKGRLYPQDADAQVYASKKRVGEDGSVEHKPGVNFYDFARHGVRTTYQNDYRFGKEHEDYAIANMQKLKAQQEAEAKRKAADDELVAAGDDVMAQKEVQVYATRPQQPEARKVFGPSYKSAKKAYADKKKQTEKKEPSFYDFKKAGVSTTYNDEYCIGKDHEDYMRANVQRNKALMEATAKRASDDDVVAASDDYTARTAEQQYAAPHQIQQDGIRRDQFQHADKELKGKQYGYIERKKGDRDEIHPLDTRHLDKHESYAQYASPRTYDGRASASMQYDMGGDKGTHVQDRRYPEVGFTKDKNKHKAEVYDPVSCGLVRPYQHTPYTHKGAYSPEYDKAQQTVDKHAGAPTEHGQAYVSPQRYDKMYGVTHSPETRTQHSTLKSAEPDHQRYLGRSSDKYGESTSHTGSPYLVADQVDANKEPRRMTSTYDADFRTPQQTGALQTARQRQEQATAAAAGGQKYVPGATDSDRKHKMAPGYGDAYTGTTYATEYQSPQPNTFATRHGDQLRVQLSKPYREGEATTGFQTTRDNTEDPCSARRIPTSKRARPPPTGGYEGQTSHTGSKYLVADRIDPTKEQERLTTTYAAEYMKAQESGVLQVAQRKQALRDANAAKYDVDDYVAPKRDVESQLPPGYGYMDVDSTYTTEFQRPSPDTYILKQHADRKFQVLKPDSDTARGAICDDFHDKTDDPYNRSRRVLGTQSSHPLSKPYSTSYGDEYREHKAQQVDKTRKDADRAEMLTREDLQMENYPHTSQAYQSPSSAARRELVNDEMFAQRQKNDLQSQKDKSLVDYGSSQVCPVTQFYTKKSAYSFKFVDDKTGHIFYVPILPGKLPKVHEVMEKREAPKRNRLY